MGAPDAGPEFVIDGRVVTKDEFDALLATLTEVPHTWFCAETDTGGRTGYDGTDADGVRWAYRAVSEPDENRSTITRVDDR